MYDTVNREDREAAIKAGALVERSLEHAIKARIVKLRKSEHKALFEGKGPLATFSAKIWVGYALGLYGPKAKHDLETIKDIRNVFAHTAHHVSFRNRRVIARIQGMHNVQRNTPPGRKPPAARDSFLDATRVFSFLLSLIVWNATPLTGMMKGGDLEE